MIEQCKASVHRGMDSGDWLLFLYIFKWAGFWTAPTWVFIFFWTLVILKIIVEIYKAGKGESRGAS